MKKIRLFSLMVSLLATAVSFTACSDDATEPDPVVEGASVTLELGAVTDESIEFTLTPVNAVKAAWVCVEDTGREVTAEQVLGCTSADAEGAQTLVADFLTPGTDYVIWAAVQGTDGVAVLSEPLKATTTGEPVVVEEFIAVEAVAEYYGGYADKNWTLALTDEEGNKALFDLYVAADSSRDYLPTTEFEVGPGGAAGTLSNDSINYTYLEVGGEKLAVESGFLAMEALLEESGDEGVVYAIGGELVAGGRSFFVAYEGLVEGTRNPNSIVEITLSAANLWEINDPQPGEFYVKLNDADWNYEVVLDFLGGSDAAYLAPGYYSMDDGSLLPKTSVTGYYSNPTADKLVACDAEIDLDGKIYTIDVVAEGDNGVKFHLVYEGEIKDMPEVVFLEELYVLACQVYDGDAMLYLTDNADDPYAGKFFATLNILTNPDKTYLDGLYEGYSDEDAEAANVTEYLCLDYSYAAVDGDFEGGVMFLPGKSFVDCITMMPAQDLNLIAFQLVATNGKIYCGEFMGPLYGGGGSVSTEPVDYPYYGVTSAEVTSHNGNAYCIEFDSYNGPMEIYFFTNDFPNTRVYSFDANGGDNQTFNGTFLKMGVEWDEPDILYEMESGRIGVINNGNNSYTFQFDNVIARAEDGSAVNLGPVEGTSYKTQFTVTIAGL